MKSPFAIFRKNQKTLLVVATFMAMFAFIFLGSFSSGGSAPDSRTGLGLLGLMMGAGVGWILGLKTKYAKEFAAGGALLGALLGIFAVGKPTAQIAVATEVKNLSERELQDLVRDRMIAKQFAVEALRRVAPEQLRYLPANQPFHLVETFDVRRDVLLGYLLRNEAQKMGIELGETAVNNFLLTWTNDKLSQTEFEQIRHDMRIPEKELYHAIGNELLALQTMRLLAPSYTQTPQQLWEFYRMMNVHEELDTAAVPVSYFNSEVPEPPQGTLQAFFEEYKNDYPGAKGPGSPGFLQPRRLRLGYIEADYEAVESEVPKVTDAEIAQYYEEHKEQLYRNRPVIDEGGTQPGAGVVPGTTPDSETPLTPNFAPDDTPEESTGNSSDTEGDAGGDADTNSSAPKDTAAPATSPDKASPDKVDPQNEDTNQGGFGRTSSAGTVSVAASRRNGTSNAVIRTVSYQPDASTSGDDATPAGTNASTSDTDSPSAASPAPEAGDTPANSGEADSKAADTKADGDPAPVVSAEPSGATAPEDLPEYQPLDEELKAEIRDELLRERTLAAMKEKIANVRQTMSDLALDRLVNMKQEEGGDAEKKPKGIPEEVKREIAADVKKLADSQGLRYVETSSLSARELLDSEKYAIGQAMEPMSNPFQRDESGSVPAVLFGSQPDQLYVAHVAEDPLTSTRFAYWKSADVESHVPKLDDPGIKDQVLSAWKTDQARPLAQTRADEVAKQLRDSEGGLLFEVLNGETVTGKPDSPPLILRQTESFSWLRPSSVPAANPWQPSLPEPSTISAIDKAGPDFMKTVFDTLKDGEVGVAPNADRSVFYVVRVKNRMPSTELGLEALREAFLRENLFYYSPYAALGSQQSVAALYDWIFDLEQKYGVHWMEPENSN